MKTLTSTWFRIVLLTTYLTQQCLSTSPVTFTALEDEDVLLRCDCHHNAKKVVWQRKIGQNDTVIISYNKADSRDSLNNSEFKDRVRLFLQDEIGNCSLLLLNVTDTDKGEYTCYGGKKPLVIHIVSLTVIARRPVVQPTPSPTTPSVPISVAIGIPVILALAVVLFVLAVCRWHRQRRKNQDTPREEVL